MENEEHDENGKQNEHAAREFRGGERHFPRGHVLQFVQAVGGRRKAGQVDHGREVIVPVFYEFEQQNGRKRGANKRQR